MVVPLRLPALLEVIEQQTAQLRGLARHSASVLLRDPVQLAGVKYFFVVAIEASIDACRHVAVSRGLRSGKDFADTFVVFGEAGLIDPDLVERLQGMARFRNLLVHGYAVVDDVKVVEILHTRLGDLDEFRRQIAQAASG